MSKQDKPSLDRHAELRAKVAGAKRLLPYLLYLVFLVILHASMDLTTGDTLDFQLMLDKHSFTDIMAIRYWTWSSLLLIEAVLVFVVRVPLLWACLDILAFLAIFHCLNLLAQLVHVGDASRWAMLCLLLCYPYPTLSEAGWIPTTVNYIWPLACGLFAGLVCAKVFLHNTDAPTPAVKALAALAAVFAANLEQVALVMWCLLVAALWYSLFVEKRLSWYLLLIWALISAECLFIVTCPGNGARTLDGIDYWWPDTTHFLTPTSYDSLTALDKLYLGFASAFDSYLYGYYSGACYLAVLFSLVLMMVALFKAKGIALKCVSVAVFLILAGIPLLRIIPFDALPWVFQRLAQYPQFGISVSRIVVSALEVIACFGIVLQLVFMSKSGDGRYGKVFALIWVLCLLSRVALGFTVSLFPSGYRIMLPLDLACIWLSSVILGMRLHDKRFAAACCFVVFCAVAMVNMASMFPQVTLWA